MTDRAPRSLRQIAIDILEHGSSHIPSQLRPSVEAMLRLGWIEEEEDYWIVAKVRNSLKRRRSRSADTIVRELAMILAHHRAERW